MTQKELKQKMLQDFLLKHKVHEGVLAEAIGVTQGAVSHWTYGHREMPESVARVIRHFNAYPDDIDNWLDYQTFGYGVKE